MVPGTARSCRRMMSMHFSGSRSSTVHLWHCLVALKQRAPFMTVSDLPRLLRSLAAPIVMIGVLLMFAVGDARTASAQEGFDRPGNDFQRRLLLSADPKDCALRCERDKRCQAWSFSWPTASGERAMCALKTSVPAPAESAGHVSGVRGASVVEPRGGEFEMFTDRYGGDFRNFEMKSDATAASCKDACAGDPKCRAWTFARAGFVGGAPRCFLKSEIKPPRRKPCCIAGVVR
jgi:hypothetical protein